MPKRAILPALMITLLLAACGGGQATEERIETQRDALAGAEEIAFTAEVTADLGDEVFACTLSCTATPEETSVEVLAPELIAGIRASVKAEETTLRYDGVQLDLGAAGTEDDSPLAAVPLLFDALRSGHIVRAWAEKDGDAPLTAAEIYVDDAHQLIVRFAADTLAPARASLSRDGAEIIRCEIRDFTFH